MLSYQKWKLLEESFGGVLGIQTPHVVGGIVGNLAGLEGIEEAKAKKKMLEDDAVPTDEVPADDDGDEDDVEKDDKDDCGCDGEKKCSKMCCKNMKKEACDDDEDVDGDDDDDSDDDEELDGEDNGEGDPDEKAKEDGKTLEIPMMMKKKMKKKMSKKMKKEHLESINAQISSDPQQKNWDGISKREDYLIPGQEEKIPGPGEVGYAPQTRFGIGSFQEWAKIAGIQKK